MGQVKPWLTIVVPAYNAEHFLEGCVASIDPESHVDIQVVLVDDGSTDLTPKLCDDFGAAYRNVDVVHKPNGGSNSARNAGFSYVKADWVWFVDSDDLIAPSALKMLRPVVAETEADAIHISFVRFAGPGDPSWPAVSSFKGSDCLTSVEFLRGLYEGSYEHFAWAFVLRAKELRAWRGDSSIDSQGSWATGPFREDLSLYDDVVTMEELLRRISGVDVLNLKLYGYRHNPSSITHRRSDSAAMSGLRAVRALGNYEVAPNLMYRKLCMEITMLFSAYRLTEGGQRSRTLRSVIRREINSRVAKVGPARLGFARLARYILLRTGLMDMIVFWRSRGLYE